MVSDFDFNTLEGKNKEEAFLMFEESARQQYDFAKNNCYSENAKYEYEREYCSIMIGFLEEYDINEIIDIAETNKYYDLPVQDLDNFFQKFQARMKQYVTRFKLRQAKFGLGALIFMQDDYKTKVAEYLNEIEKIVNNQVHDARKKDRIFKLISKLRLEINREKTSVENFCLVLGQLSEAIGEAAKNLEPLTKRLKEIKELFWSSSDFIPLLPKQKKAPKMIEDRSKLDEIDDIPF